jgi:hypothetical protein
LTLEREHGQEPADLIDAYLAQLELELHAGPEMTQEILREVRSHLELGLSEGIKHDAGNQGSAFAQALQRFGPARQIGQQFRRVHGRATWMEAGLAALPTLVFAIARPALAGRVSPPLLIVLPLIAVTLLARRLRWPLWWWAWIGWLPSAIPRVPSEAMWTVLLYVVLLALVLRRDWLEATLATYPLPTFWTFRYMVLSSFEVQSVDWGSKTLLGLSAVVSITWAVLLMRTLRVPAGFARIRRALESQGIVVLLNVGIVVAARMWPTYPYPYPFTWDHLARITLPYLLLRGPPFLLFALLTALPALLALVQSQARRPPPSRRAWSG